MEPFCSNCSLPLAKGAGFLYVTSSTANRSHRMELCDRRAISRIKYSENWHLGYYFYISHIWYIAYNVGIPTLLVSVFSKTIVTFSGLFVLPFHCYVNFLYLKESDVFWRTITIRTMKTCNILCRHVDSFFVQVCHFKLIIFWEQEPQARRITSSACTY